mmetsp:Transcript_28848/g.51383  ORF Transcript_28848/g.51383 Transcript_28848/m.51383 type:complete len:697 (+) Transcript_28848:24-2114(+)
MEDEHIKVAIRFRPLNDDELRPSQEIAWQLGKHNVTLLPQTLGRAAEDKRGPSGSQFEYDYCFGWTDDNCKVYETVAKKIVLSALEGYNASIFAYGQTGSGKTFTMLGKYDETPEQSDSSISTPKKIKNSLFKPDSSRKKLLSVTPFRSRSTCSTPRNKPIKHVKSPSQSVIRPFRSINKGLLLLALEDIFERVAGESERHYFFTCSYLEIYNEHVYDLLSDLNELKSSQLAVVEGSDKEFSVRGLTEKVVTCLADAMNLVRRGEENRHYASTCLNHHSSRSHTIFKLNVRSLQVITKNTEDESFENITMESVINFVDLAGSERLSSFNSEERTLQPKTFNLNSKSDSDKLAAEGKTINTSLFYLCQVINKLSEQRIGLLKNDAHIPFRNSNLTKILKGSLGGNSRTCIVFTASPASGSLDQTLSTLKFASRARSVTNRVFANVRRETSTQLLLAYETDIATLKRELEQAQCKNALMSKENISVKAQLESKVQSLTRKLLDKPCNVLQQASQAPGELWLSGVGEIFGSLKPSRVVTQKQEVLKYDDEGVFALKRLKQMKVEREELRKIVKDLSSSVTCLKATKTSLVYELDLKSSTIENLSKICDSLDAEKQVLQTELGAVKDQLALFQGTADIASLDEAELDNLADSLTKSLNSINKERADRLSRKKLANLQGLLRDVVPAELLQSVWRAMEGGS